MADKAFQDYYPDKWSHCFGCGRLNERGHQLKSRWDDEHEETVATFLPEPYHTALPGFVYGGLIASLIDCHGTGSAAAAAYRSEGRDMNTDPPRRFVTASLHVDYHKPTPLGVPLELRGKIAEIKGRKVIVDISVSAEGQKTASGRVVAVQVPDNWEPEG